MLIFDKETPEALAGRLEHLKKQSAHARCIFFSLHHDNVFADKVAKLLPEIAGTYFSNDHTQCFICVDGDIFILAPTIAAKDGKAFIQAMADALDRNASDDWVRFLDLPLHLNILLYEVTAKLEQAAAAGQQRHQREAEQQLEHKRNSILNGHILKKSSEIKQRRQERKHPELMIIEDDSFSRRLVENILSKHYSLTGLGDVTYALDIYARVAPDLLFLDINLPDVTGHELLERIMAIDPDAYVIMLSGNCDKHNILKAMDRGAKGFVGKPFNREKLIHYIQHCPTIK